MKISQRLTGLSMACAVLALAFGALTVEPASAGFLNNIFGGGKNNNNGMAAPISRTSNRRRVHLTAACLAARDAIPTNLTRALSMAMSFRQKRGPRRPAPG